VILYETIVKTFPFHIATVRIIRTLMSPNEGGDSATRVLVRLPLILFINVLFLQVFKANSLNEIDNIKRKKTSF